MKWRIRVSMMHNQRKIFSDIVDGFNTAQEAHDYYRKKGYKVESVSPEEEPITNSSKYGASVPMFMDELPDTMSDILRDIGKKMNERMESNMLDSIRYAGRAAGCLPPGSLVYNEDGKITRREGYTYGEEDYDYIEGETWFTVRRFFKRKG